MNIHALALAISYDPDTGEMIWNRKTGTSKEVKRWNARYAGKPALRSISTAGYFTGTINKNHVKAHRAAWAIVHGYWPDMEIDHVNGDRSDNRICNLREATHAQNAQNSRKRKGGLSVYRGVSLDRKRWRAVINADGVRTRLGSFDTEEKAAIAYDIFAHVMHGEFARPNIMHDRDAITAFIEEYVDKNHKRIAIDGVRQWEEKEAF